MRLLLDTCSFLWFVAGSPSLSVNARTLIEDTDNRTILSVASIWEVTIKTSIGRLHLGQPAEVFIPDQLSRNGFTLLPISHLHALRVASLPVGDHRDPFDRLLAAQGLVESVPIISCDIRLDQYGVIRLW